MCDDTAIPRTGSAGIARGMVRLRQIRKIPESLSYAVGVCHIPVPKGGREYLLWGVA